MNLTEIYFRQKTIYDFMYHHNIRIYHDSTYTDYNWRIEIDHSGPYVFDFADRFNISYTEFKRIMCYDSDCLFNLQLFGFKTKVDAIKSISNLCIFARGGDRNKFSWNVS